MNSLSTFASILYLIGLVAAAKFPQHLRRCHAGNTTCIAETMETFVRDYKTGLREINLVSIDPLRVNKVDIIQSANSPVNINLVFKNISLYGLGDLKAKRVVGFEKDPATSKFEIYGFVERLALISQYKVNGKIIILPVVGTGAANLTFDNVEFSLKLLPKVEIKKDKQYLTFSEVKLDFDTSRLWMNFENLFKGDKALGEGTNKFINENWLDILNELKPVLRTAIGDICMGIISPIFAKFPYEQIFL